jgi:hypothetical protein
MGAAISREVSGRRTLMESLGRNTPTTPWSSIPMTDHPFLNCRTTRSMCAIVLGSLAISACSGREVPMGTGISQSAYSGPIVSADGCSPDQCAQRMTPSGVVPVAYACALGQTNNLRCEPDPAAGTGSTPVGACSYAFDCVDNDGGAANATCSPDRCANQAIACVQSSGQPAVATNVRCVPDPAAGQGTVPVGACTLTADCVPDDAGH